MVEEIELSRLTCDVVCKQNWRAQFDVPSSFLNFDVAVLRVVNKAKIELC